MTAVEVFDSNEELPGLIETIKREHVLTLNAFRSMLPHAIEAGTALLRARQIIGEAAWTQWLKDNFELGQQTAKIYQRLATYRRQIEKAIDDGWHGGLNEAMTLVSGLPPVLDRSYSENVKREARELANLGMIPAAIADICGVSQGTVATWLDPEVKSRKQAASGRIKKRRRAERRALAQQERDQAVRSHGGDAASVYAILRRAALTLEFLRIHADTEEARDEFRQALSAVHRGEDHITKALRIDREVIRPRGRYA